MPSEMLFGTRLRAERERRGVSLEDVAQATKVSRAVFAEMERGRFDKWPPGIYGRSFMRGYAEAVGLDADEVVAEFVSLFPDETEVATLGAADADTTADVGVGFSAASSVSNISRATNAGQPDGGPVEPRQPADEPVEAMPLLIDRSVLALGEIGSSPAERPRGALRLVLAEVDDDDTGTVPPGPALAPSTLVRIAGATLDLALVVAPAGVAAAFGAQSATWLGVALVGAIMLVATTAAVQASPGAWALRRYAERRPTAISGLVGRLDAGASASDDTSEEFADDLYLSPAVAREATERPWELEVSPNFYRPSDLRRFNQRARHA